MYIARWMCALWIAMLAAGCGDDDSRAPGTAPLIIDTDMSYDDAMAILYLLQHSDFEVEAITVTGNGMARIEPGTQNALGLLTLVGRPDVVVARGSDVPLAGSNPSFIPEAWHDDADSLLGVAVPQSELGPSPTPAADLMRQTIGNAEQKVTIVALGPLTNVAQALGDDPGMVADIEHIYIMGGAVDVGGNVQYGGDPSNPYAEWNIFCDPTAAKIVLESGAPITMVPLDATDHVPGTVEYAQRVAADGQTPAAEFVAELLARLDEAQALGDWFYFWDALAAAIATDRGLATIEQTSILIVTEDGTESGRTREDSAGVAIDVATEANAAAFEDEFFAVLNGQ